MKNTMYIALIAIGFILTCWLVLSLYVQREAAAKTIWLGREDSERQVLIVYDPDPIYNLDEQVGMAIAESLSQNDWAVALKTVRATDGDKLRDYDLIVVIANTYNWAPDRAVKNFVGRCSELHKPFAATTLGAGSTSRAQRLLEQAVLASGNKLIASQKLWLMRPNDEERIKEDNVEVARDMARQWAQEVNNKYEEDYSLTY